MKKPLLDLFALSALFMKIPDCKTWRQPSRAALGFTFTREGKPGKNQAIKVSGSLAPWKMRFSLFCGGRAEETSDLSEAVGGRQHPPVAQLGATTCQVHCGNPMHTGVVEGSLFHLLVC